MRLWSQPRAAAVGQTKLDRWRRPLYFALAVVLGALAILQVVLGFAQFGWDHDGWLDFSVYLQAADRFVHGQ